MITAVDTSVLLDVFGADHTFGTASGDFVRRGIAEGQLVACEVVWAEVGGFFPSPAQACEAMQWLGVEFSPLTLETALEAAAAWKNYRRRGGPRSRVAADFLIGAHAMQQADRLLTRDCGFYRQYFKPLVLLDPSAHK